MFRVITPFTRLEYLCASEVLESLITTQKNLVLIRGLPGSGKSTLARELVNFNHFEADMYFIKDGQYTFDKSRLQKAHEWCFNQTISKLLKKESVCVSNTFVKKWEAEKYIKAAQEIGAELIIIECLSQYKTIHGVPQETMERMKRQWESF